MNSHIARVPKGTSAGGRFAAHAKQEGTVTLDLPDQLARPAASLNLTERTYDPSSLPEGVRVSAIDPDTGRRVLGQVKRVRGKPHLVGNANSRERTIPLTEPVTVDQGSAVRLLPHIEHAFHATYDDWYTNPDTAVSDVQMTSLAGIYAQTVNASLPKYVGDSRDNDDEQARLCADVDYWDRDRAEYDIGATQTRKMIAAATDLYDTRAELGLIREPRMADLAEEANTLPAGPPQAAHGF